MECRRRQLLTVGRRTSASSAISVIVTSCDPTGFSFSSFMPSEALEAWRNALCAHVRLTGQHVRNSIEATHPVLGLRRDVGDEPQDRGVVGCQMAVMDGLQVRYAVTEDAYEVQVCMQRSTPTPIPWEGPA